MGISSHETRNTIIITLIHTMLINMESEFTVHEIGTSPPHFDVKIAHTADTGAKEMTRRIFLIPSEKGVQYQKRSAITKAIT